MRVLLAQKPDMTLKELREALGLDCSLPAIHYVLSEMGLTYKKRCSRASEQDRPDIARARKASRRRQLGFDSAKLVFIDESNAKTNMTRLRGRTLRGKRLYASAPQSHWHTTTMICSMRWMARRDHRRGHRYGGFSTLGAPSLVPNATPR
jgi:hypothetical protein